MEPISEAVKIVSAVNSSLLAPSATTNTRTSQHECRMCADTGYQGWKTPHAGYSMEECIFCECATGQRVLEYWKRKSVAKKQADMEKLFVGACIPAHFRSFTLDSIRQRAVNEPDKKAAIDAVEQWITAGYVEDPATKRYKSGLILAGDYGRGKTGTLTPAIRHSLEQGKSGLWIEVTDFVGVIQSGYRDGTSLERLEAAQKVDVILLDDLGDKSRDGAETDDRRRIIYQLVNYRHNNGLPMLITTNLNGQQMAAQFGGRTVERIMESCAWVSMGGRNLRRE